MMLASYAAIVLVYVLCFYIAIELALLAFHTIYRKHTPDWICLIYQFLFEGAEVFIFIFSALCLTILILR
jgi:heme/copper-type cytochrome/quinol oxidase subunit 4